MCSRDARPRAELSEPTRPGRHRRIEADEDLDSGVRFVLDLDDGPGGGRHSVERDNRAAALDIASAGVLITEPGWAHAANTATVPAETARPATSEAVSRRAQPSGGDRRRARSRRGDHCELAGVSAEFCLPCQSRRRLRDIRADPGDRYGRGPAIARAPRGRRGRNAGGDVVPGYERSDSHPAGDSLRGLHMAARRGSGRLSA